jgi:hypothetical protein
MISTGLSCVLALVILVAFTLGVSFVIGGAGIARLIVGEDDRGSTSKAQALLWTFAVAFALLSLLLRDPSKISDQGISTDYLYLLGFPAATLVASKGITLHKTQAGTVAKAGRSAPTLWLKVRSVLADLFVDDSGDPSLHDTQIILFNLLAVAWYVVTFLQTPTNPFPDLPDTLLVLSGVASATYVGGKLVANQSPAINAIFPSQAAPGDLVTITGANFDKTGGPKQDGTPMVSFGSKAVGPTSIDATMLKAKVPDEIKGTEVQVSVMNTSGLISSPATLAIVQRSDANPPKDGSNQHD